VSKSTCTIIVIAYLSRSALARPNGERSFTPLGASGVSAYVGESKRPVERGRVHYHCVRCMKDVKEKERRMSITMKTEPRTECEWHTSVAPSQLSLIVAVKKG
jgi:hypothetical protein